MTEAVFAVATSEALIVARTSLPEMTVVTRGAPFHFTTAREAKPVPFIVRVNFPLPGATFSGTNGWFSSGTGFDCANKAAVKARKTNGRKLDFMTLSKDSQVLRPIDPLQ